MLGDDILRRPWTKAVGPGMIECYQRRRPPILSSGEKYVEGEGVFELLIISGLYHHRVHYLALNWLNENLK